jgi:hypothetical protein
VVRGRHYISIKKDREKTQMNPPELTIITTGRIDNYEGDPTGRLIKSVEHNCNLLELHGISYEYLIGEWFPQDKPFYYHPRTKDLFDKYNLKDIVIDSSLAEPEELHPTKFAEYFAKNACLKKAQGQYILITNSDIIFGELLVEEIAKQLKDGLDRNKFYRTHRRSQIHPESHELLNTDELYIPNQFEDSHLCAGYSGDFLMAHRDVLLEDAQGYDEYSGTHRRGTQTSCDGEILWKLDSLGIKLALFHSPYFHIWHSKGTCYDSSGYTKGNYKQKPDWGFVKYPCTEEVLDKLYIIHAN